MKLEYRAKEMTELAKFNFAWSLVLLSGLIIFNIPVLIQAKIGIYAYLFYVTFTIFHIIKSIPVFIWYVLKLQGRYK